MKNEWKAHREQVVWWAFHHFSEQKDQKDTEKLFEMLEPLELKPKLGCETPNLMTDEDRKRSRTPFRCPKCDMPPTFSEIALLRQSFETVCRNCYETFQASQAKILVLRGSQRFLDLDTVKNSVWYHKTRQDDWPKRPLADENKPMVHIGTYQAAMQASIDPGTAYLYRIRLSDSATIHQNFVPDRGWWIASSEKYEYSAYRYINRWESPGSISLIVNPKHIEVIRRTSVL